MSQTATKSDDVARFMAAARNDNQTYRRSALIEELMASLDELCRQNQQGESHELRLRAQRKHIGPTVAKLVAYLERQ